MFRSVQIMVAGLSLAVVAGCASPGGAQAGSPFDRVLSAAYLERSQHELGENDYRNADLFASKGRAAARGEQVDPEVVANWDVPPETVAELEAARARLVRVKAKVLAVDPTGRYGLARRTARAQMLFDCWLEEQEENIQPPHISYCKSGFEDLLGQVEPRLAEPKPRPMPTFVPMAEPAPAPAPAPAPVAAPAPAPEPSIPRSYLVFFDWDSAELTPEALKIVRTAASNAQKAGYNVIEVTGHADRSGPDQYNMRLSMRRAVAVRRELERQGIVPGGTSVFAKGERDPLVPTPDGVREPQNRRVEIVLK